MRRIETTPHLLILAVPAAVLTASAPPQAPLDLSARAVVARAAAYIEQYQQQLKFVLASEVYTQQIVRQVPADPAQQQTRTLRSEVFFMFPPAGDGWMTIRDVLEVDGEAVGSRPDVLEALRTLHPREVARTFATYNSRFNLGRTSRNFNEPTLALLVLDDLHRDRFSFDRKRVERTPRETLVALSFTERERPTLIRDVRHGSVFSRGELIVHAETGSVRRAVLTARADNIRFELTTEFAPEERLGILVPVRFQERYEYGPGRAGRERIESGTEYEEILCEAKYSDYRRFETGVRIK